MIVLRCEQGSPEWRQARCGIPTASRFDRIITPKTRKASAQQVGLRNELLAEWISGTPSDDFASEFMQRGKLLEPEAVAAYEWERGVTVDRVGFVRHDDLAVGCSPDGLVGDDGGLEIKCYGMEHHIGALLSPNPDAEHLCQIQGCLWITDRRWWDRYYYHPTLPSVLVRVERDEEFIHALAVEVEAFVHRLEEAKGTLRKMGVTPTDPTAYVDTWSGPPAMAPRSPEQQAEYERRSELLRAARAELAKDFIK